MTVPVPGQLTYSYDEDGVTTVFAYPVRFLDASELVVVREVDGFPTTLILNTDYTVSGAGSPSGGSITRTAVTDGGRVIIRRKTVYKQIVDLQDSARNPAEAVELQLDRMAMAGQDVDERLAHFEDAENSIFDAAKIAVDAKDASEAAQEAAEDARDIAAGYASDAVSQGNVPIYATVVGMSSLEVPAGINAIRVNGYYTAGDGGAAVYTRSESEPTHIGKFQSQDGAWWELSEREAHADMFGIAKDGSDVTDALNGARLYAYQKGDRTLRLGVGTYGVSDTVLVGAGGTSSESSYQNCGLTGCGSAHLNSSNSATKILWVGDTDADKAVVRVEGRISGVGMSGIQVDCAKKARDGLVLRSVYGSKFSDILVREFRRNGVDVGVQSGGNSSWYSSHNSFDRVSSLSSHVEQSGEYETCAWFLGGDAAIQAGAWGNVYTNCIGLVYRDASFVARPRAIHMAYTDSSTFVECDFTLSWSGIDGNGDIVTGTPASPQGQGYGPVYDATSRNQFPLNMMFYGCSLVGAEHVVEDDDHKIGTIIYTNQTSRDWEGAPQHPSIIGFNDRGMYFGKNPIQLRGDGQSLRFIQQNLARYWDILYNVISGGNESGLEFQRTSGGVTTVHARLLQTGVFEPIAGMRSFRHTVGDDAVVTVTPTQTEGNLVLVREGSVTQNALIAYDVVGTPNVDLMAKGSSANIAVTTGVLSGTTGDDGKLTVSPAGDGKIYIENRTGATISVRGTLM